jgi:hypothetical protein
MESTESHLLLLLSVSSGLRRVPAQQLRTQNQPWRVEYKSERGVDAGERNACRSLPFRSSTQPALVLLYP